MIADLYYTVYNMHQKKEHEREKIDAEGIRRDFTYEKENDYICGSMLQFAGLYAAMHKVTAGRGRKGGDYRDR